MRLARTALLLACPLLLAGCIAINGTSSSQPQSMGPVNLTVSACADQSPGCSGTANNGSAYAFLQAADSDATIPVQTLVAVRLPQGSTPPDSLTGNLAGGGTLPLNRSASYEAELQALEPAPAGERWWGWLSDKFIYSRNSKQGFTTTIQTTLPPTSDGSPLPSPMHWRPVVGVREVDGSGPPLPTTRPVDCGIDNADLYDGYNERTPGSATETVVCIDSPAADATRGFLEAAIVDFGVLGTNLSAPAGSTVTATFLAKRSGAADAATTFALAASGGPPGGSVTLDRTSVSLGGDSTTAVLATIAIPPGTAPGDYPITVTATAAGKPTRQGVAVLTVPAPPAPPAPPPAAADTTRPVISSASLSRKRFRVGAASTPITATAAGTVVRFKLSEAGKVTLTVQRLVKRRWKRAGALNRSLPAGAARVKFSGRLGKRKLAAGKYRLRLLATDAAGNRSAVKTLPFTIVSR